MANRSIGPSSWAAPASVVLTLGIAVSGSVGNLPIVPDTLSIDYALLGSQSLDFTSGNNTVNIPVSSTNEKATVCVIIPPRNNTTAWTTKGVAGDTGMPQNPNAWKVETFPSTSAPTTFVINVGADVGGFLLLWF